MHFISTGIGQSVAHQSQLARIDKSRQRLAHESGPKPRKFKLMTELDFLHDKHSKMQDLRL